MGRKRKGSYDFGWNNHSPTTSDFAFKAIKGSSSAASLNKPQAWHEKFRPEFNLKDFSILDDYNYSSMWTRWRRGYELYMYANQALVGLNYSFRYSINGQGGSGGTVIPGLLWMYPSKDQDMGMRTVMIRPRDSFNLLDFGISIKEVFDYDIANGIIGVELSESFGAPVAYFTNEVVSDRFNAAGEEKATYNNYTVVAVGTRAGGPNVPDPLPVQNTLFLSKTLETSWTVVDNKDLVAPASSNPIPGEFFSTAMRMGCNCPDFLGREDFNLYKYSLKRSYPLTGVQDLKPGIYDPGNETQGGSTRPTNTRDFAGFTRDFGFIYTNRLLDISTYKDDAGSSYSDPNLFFFQPRFCKHIYASFWDMQNRFSEQDQTSVYLAQPSDEPMDGRYREYFQKTLEKQTESLRMDRNLDWWEAYSPSRSDIPTHIMYSDMMPTVVKVLNFDTLSSGVVNPMVASGFEMFSINDYNPIIPVPPENQPIFDGGRYEDGFPIGSGATVTFDGGVYINGVLQPPLFRPLVNGGTY